MYLDSSVVPPEIQCSIVTLPLRNLLLYVVTSGDFVTFKIAVTSNCNGTVTVKNE
jgi:hypothetical protein